MASTPLVSFNFKFVQFGIIPSSRKGNTKESFVKFQDSLKELVDNTIKQEGLKATEGNVFVFIAQFFSSESEYKTRDVDNMISSILNTLSGRCYVDDGQVTSLLIAKETGVKLRENFYFIGIKFLGSKTEPGILQKAGLYEAWSLYKTLNRS